MKKNFLKLTLICLLAILVVALIACDNTTTIPDPDDDGTGDVDDTPTPITFTVTFDSKGGTSIEGYTDISFGQCVPVPSATPTKTGYIFDGWTLSDGTAVDFDTYTICSNITFFASWKAKNYDIPAFLTDEKRKDNIININTDTVSEYYGDAFALSNSTLDQKDIDGVSVWGTTLTLSYESTNASTQSLPVPTTSKEGDRFMYWYYYEGDTLVPLTSTLAQGSQKKEVALLNGYKYDGSRTIYAMWYSALDNITVTFNSGREDITLSMDNVVIKEGDHLSRPDTPQASGFDFNNWTYILKDDEDNDVSCDMTFYVDPSAHGTHITTDMTTDNVFTLYANWTRHIEITSASDWTSLDTTDEEVQKANIYLMNDITLNDYTTKFGISSSDSEQTNAFSGVFDGKGNTITINIVGGLDGYYSFIGINDGVIKNVNFTASSITVNDAEIDGTIYAGLVAGMSKGTITGVKVDLTSIVISAENATAYIGGIVGANYDELSDTAIANLGITVAGKAGNVGGVVGYNVSGFILNSTIVELDIVGNMTNNGCAGLVAGKITYGDTTKIVVSKGSINLNAGASGYAGGIAGLVSNNSVSECAITNCDIFVGKDLIGTSAYVGGIVGQGGSAIRHASVSAINVEATSTKICVAGGLVGINFCEGGNRGQIQFSVASGTVSAKSYGKIYAGGISGQQNAGASSSTGAVAYVYAEFNVSATRLSSGDDATETPVKIGKAFGSLDKTTTCQNVYLADSSTITIDGVEYNADDNQYNVTTHTATVEITPGFETIQNATWVSKQLKLDSNVWIVSDGSYPTLKISA